MRKIALLLVVGFALVILGVSCSIINPPITSPTSTPKDIKTTPATSNPILTNSIGELLKSPDRIGEQVDIVGYFHGWDLLNEVGSSPPITRSDWVIADNSGAIYVTGLLPADLDPSSPDQEWQVIHLMATVKVHQNQVYLEAQSVDLIPEP
jgi:hypothetical protein